MLKREKQDHKTRTQLNDDTVQWNFTNIMFMNINLCTQWALYLGASDCCLESSTKAITPNHLHSNKSKDVAPNPFGNLETSWEHATVTSFVQTIVWISLKNNENTQPPVENTIFLATLKTATPLFLSVWGGLPRQVFNHQQMFGFTKLGNCIDHIRWFATWF